MFVRDEEIVPGSLDTPISPPTHSEAFPSAPVSPASPASAAAAVAAAAEDNAHERPHHPTSPSQLQNLEACPCYAGRGGTSEAAERGTKQHAASETGHDDGSMKDEEAAAVAQCMDLFEREKTLLMEARERIIAGGNPDPGLVYEVREIYLPIDNRQHHILGDHKEGVFTLIDTNCTTGGFVDAVILSGKHALAMDWKFGQWPVEETANNLQAIAYTLGLFKLFPNVDEVRFIFFQPHIDHYTEHTFFRHEAPTLYLRVTTIVERVKTARTMGNFDWALPQVPVCNFCGRIGRCTKVAALVLKVADKFFPGEVPDNITPTSLHDSKDTALCLRLGQIVVTWAEAFKRITTDRVIRGESDIPVGYTLQKKSNRELVDKAMFKTVAQRYVTAAELEGIAEYGLGNLEGLISDAAPRGTKTAKIEEFKTALLSSGAMQKGPEFSFLKAVAVKKDKQQAT
jgi:hypothetical protein